ETHRQTTTDMMSELPRPPSFWKTVRLLLGAARKRASGRQKRQRELFQARSRKTSIDWGPLGFALTVLLMIILNVVAAFVVRAAVAAGERIEAERQGKIVVSRWFFSLAQIAEAGDRTIDADYYSAEARRIAAESGGKEEVIEQKLRDAVREHGSGDFVSRDQASSGFSAFAALGALPAMLGSLVLIWWAVMLVFHGEGLELDLQRRRHPIWEFLFSHPVPAGAIFLAEMLSPIAANPIYWGGPLF